MNIAETPLAHLLGADLHVPVLGGGKSRYINLDNAATTPALVRVWNRLAEIMPWYGSVHRGAGFKSVVSTRIFEAALERILNFSDGHSETDALILGWNTTSCVNNLARRLNLDRDSLVVLSEIEHSSNVLPWRKFAPVTECRSSADGTIDLDRLESILKSRRARLVAITAASNVTGALVDVHAVARLAHQYGAQIFVDAAQLVAHRKLERRPADSPEHLDFVAYAGHKMYAPFGIGVLVGKRATFNHGWPDTPGGGTVKLIDGDEILWADLPEREQGGTPNFPGVIALSEACSALTEIGFERIVEHEQALTTHAKSRLGQNPGVKIHKALNEKGPDSIALFPFSLDKYHPALVGAFLGIEHAIGVRAGHLCQYELVRRLLGVDEGERKRIFAEVESGDRRHLYGIVRASCGLGTTIHDIDALGDALYELIEHGTKAQYVQGLDGEYLAQNWSPELPLAPGEIMSEAYRYSYR